MIEHLTTACGTNGAYMIQTPTHETVCIVTFYFMLYVLVNWEAVLLLCSRHNLIPYSILAIRSTYVHVPLEQFATIRYYQKLNKMVHTQRYTKKKHMVEAIKNVGRYQCLMVKRQQHTQTIGHVSAAQSVGRPYWIIL